MSSGAGDEVEARGADLIEHLDRLAASVHRLGEPPEDGHRQAARPIEARAREQRERIAALEQDVAAAKQRAAALLGQARAAVDRSCCDRIERREWPRHPAGVLEGLRTDRGAASASAAGAVGEHVALARARSFIDLHASEAIGIDAVADASQVSARYLQALFRRHHGTTPLGHLREVRLDRVHDELCAADPTSGVTVEAIARKWHFTHLGRFARYYRERFGHHPSQILRTVPTAELQLLRNGS